LRLYRSAINFGFDWGRTTSLHEGSGIRIFIGPGFDPVPAPYANKTVLSDVLVLGVFPDSEGLLCIGHLIN
jgi:hypothetical protein